MLLVISKILFCFLFILSAIRLLPLTLIIVTIPVKLARLSRMCKRILALREIFLRRLPRFGARLEVFNVDRYLLQGRYGA